ncbi:hypothetical protein PoB_006644000 [Plakobranchus ocellatus]|uniref:Uncharacterized protein n=1 Tax=Plakobranchus ocellatus TaxID=259542 RepID=A0AAV4D7A8_9GAST|nr:hypothetical protein PoB_006644000 [Plakobranchus ocellatus]
MFTDRISVEAQIANVYNCQALIVFKKGGRAGSIKTYLSPARAIATLDLLNKVVYSCVRQRERERVRSERKGTLCSSAWWIGGLSNGFTRCGWSGLPGNPVLQHAPPTMAKLTVLMSSFPLLTLKKEDKRKAKGVGNRGGD